MKKKETQEAERISVLQKQISKVSTEIAQKTHYQRQLEHMLQRLQRNQVLHLKLSTFYLYYNITISRNGS